MEPRDYAPVTVVYYRRRNDYVPGWELERQLQPSDQVEASQLLKLHDTEEVSLSNMFNVLFNNSECFLGLES